MLSFVILENRRKHKDFNQIAKSIVDRVTSVDEKATNDLVIGRSGGLKGGKARANSLSIERRREIAEKAAAKRWDNH